MSLAEKLERLARIVPGVGGYQDDEAARRTDKVVRMKLASQLDDIRLDLENEKRRLVEINDLSLLPDFDRTTSKLFKSANEIRYAARGFSGIFDEPRVDHTRLEEMLAFDLSLFGDVEDLKTLMKNVSAAFPDASLGKRAIERFGEAADILDRKLLSRRKY